ncbi:hypothetical protein [Aliarcobacter vitoriensis]|uniref:N-acetyltransferase domain-containing protein n=1 Tax=Aliarcobacter vitoriensis TaxID=2011099 RepID=A0A366MVL5_9BACT|nr:hypothetical protein [Aliarcobacter vitoriensis]RBQ30097.1 hypothetical protein CRU91_00190 [Aliarcobacter vitoriensis]
MKIIKLEKKHKDDFIYINQDTKQTLENPDFFIGFFSNNEIDEFLKDDKKAIFYGCLEGEHLIALSGLIFDVEDFYDELTLLNIKLTDCVEIGASMTLLSARGKGCMLNINKELIKIAKAKNIKYLLATAHPNNIASNKSLTNLGMKFIKEYKRHGYLRNLYIKDLTTLI